MDDISAGCTLVRKLLHTGHQDPSITDKQRPMLSENCTDFIDSNLTKSRQGADSSVSCMRSACVDGRKTRTGPVALYLALENHMCTHQDSNISLCVIGQELLRLSCKTTSRAEMSWEERQRLKGLSEAIASPNEATAILSQPGRLCSTISPQTFILADRQYTQMRNGLKPEGNLMSPLNSQEKEICSFSYLSAAESAKRRVNARQLTKESQQASQSPESQTNHHDITIHMVRDGTTDPEQDSNQPPQYLNPVSDTSQGTDGTREAGRLTAGMAKIKQRFAGKGGKGYEELSDAVPTQQS